MWPYIVILFTIMLWIFSFKKVTGRNEIFIPIILLTILYSIRNYNVGTDTPAYVSKFMKSFDYNYYYFNPNVEYGYQLLEYLILGITHEYFLFFTLISLIIIPLYILTINKVSVNYFYSILIYFTFGFYTFFFNGLRQGIAMAICFSALPFLLQNNFFKYFLLVILASFFHISALIMLPIYFIVNLKMKIELKFLFILFASISLSQIIIEYLAQDNIRYENYTQEVDNPGGYLTLFFYFSIAIFFYFSGIKNRKQDIKYSKMEQIFFLGLAIIMPISLLGTDPSGPQRLLYYFVSMVIFLLPYYINKYKNLYFNIGFFILCIIYFTLTTMRFSNLYPYQINPIFGLF
ncbi:MULTISPECIES: EpsG family protein [unclassified Acinetobacter]|uniref:EpsG family protein n=1 Tax=unclassified Acinetobacter TaxID=196816 RepID=UPI0029346380|nr:MULTISPECIES: EpsG family protein [unclassified Acinetobacter]WOE30897.1 EpsG family protein [Acinetobacter sp. SAAs470]WOE39092.1 EpsG family protein [Acinetobacter sp. SAAs474]